MHLKLLWIVEHLLKGGINKICFRYSIILKVQSIRRTYSTVHYLNDVISGYFPSPLRFFAIFKKVEHHLEPDEMPLKQLGTFTVRLRLFFQFTYVQYCVCRKGINNEETHVNANFKILKF